MIHTKFSFFPSSAWLLRLEDEPDALSVRILSVDDLGMPAVWVAEGRTFGRAVTGETWEEWCRWMTVLSIEADLEDLATARFVARGVR